MSPIKRALFCCFPINNQEESQERKEYFRERSTEKSSLVNTPRTLITNNNDYGTTVNTEVRLTKNTVEESIIITTEGAEVSSKLLNLLKNPNENYIATDSPEVLYKVAPQKVSFTPKNLALAKRLIYDTETKPDTELESFLNNSFSNLNEEFIQKGLNEVLVIIFFKLGIQEPSKTLNTRLDGKVDQIEAKSKYLKDSSIQLLKILKIQEAQLTILEYIKDKVNKYDNVDENSKLFSTVLVKSLKEILIFNIQEQNQLIDGTFVFKNNTYYSFFQKYEFNLEKLEAIINDNKSLFN